MNLKTLPEQLYMYPVREPQSNSLSTIEPETLILTTQYHYMQELYVTDVVLVIMLCMSMYDVMYDVIRIV